MQREHCLRGDRGSWTERAPGDPEPGGKAERPGTAQKLDGDPQGPDPGNAGEGRPPRRRFLLPGCRSPRIGKQPLPDTTAQCGAMQVKVSGNNVGNYVAPLACLI